MLTDGSNLQNILFTKSPGISLSEPLKIEHDCEKLTTCFTDANNLTLTKIYTDPDNEVIRVTRVLLDPEGQFSDCYQLNDDIEWFGGPQMRYLNEI